MVEKDETEQTFIICYVNEADNVFEWRAIYVPAGGDINEGLTEWFKGKLHPEDYTNILVFDVKDTIKRLNWEEKQRKAIEYSKELNDRYLKNRTEADAARDFSIYQQLKARFER